MGNIICCHKGCYNIYSTISDRFIFDPPLTLRQLEQYIKDEYGNQGTRDLPGRLERANWNGCSSLSKDEDLESLLICNRAGKKEKHLSFDECVKQFLTLNKGGVKMIKRNKEIIINPTVSEVAQEFCEMGADEQACFFNEIGAISSKWKRPFCIQLQSIVDTGQLNTAGKQVMDLIGMYAYARGVE